MTRLTKRTNKTWSQVIPDPKKWPLFTKSAIKNSNSYFLTKILTCPNFLDVRASTDVKRGQKFQLEPDQNPIGTWVEPDKSRCIYCAWSKTLGLLANSPSSNKGMQIRRWATIKLKQWVLYNRSKILHMAVPKEGISCLYLVKTWVLYINAPATTSHMISYSCSWYPSGIINSEACLLQFIHFCHYTCMVITFWSHSFNIIHCYQSINQ